MTIHPRINPIESLAVSMQSQPGVYALLLGSGVSSGAGIMTGWQITLDLVRKLAASQQEDVGDDPASWYESKYGELPNYSRLLEALAKYPIERQNLLRPYFEPNDAERADGVKIPTVSHRAIAELVKNGYIRVIITTNFDKLLEQALRDHGVEPTVLDSPDNVRGALPLAHIENCVFKIHGDYLDSEIRNTPDELASYPESYDDLLDRIFDEYGLVVCGWSSESDEALAAAMSRSTTRRFTTFWTKKDELNERATKIAAHREATIIDIATADDFFQESNEKVKILQEYGRDSELSTASAVSVLKTVLQDPSQQIRHTDLVRDVVGNLASVLSQIPIGPPDAPLPNGSNLNDRIVAYENLSSTLRAMAPIAGRWASETYANIWREALRQIATVDAKMWNDVWFNLHMYPALLTMYGFCVGAIAGRNLDMVGSLLRTQVMGPTGEPLSFYSVLGDVQSNLLYSFRGRLPLNGYEQSRTPVSDRIHDVLRSNTEQILVSTRDYSLIFDEFEILLTMGYATQFPDVSYWGPVGRYVYRYADRERVLTKIRTSIETEGVESPYLVSGMFGETADECFANIAKFNDFADVARFR